ncbi:13548_t:CDS:2, partial [Acaulospora colombiana]
SEDAGLNVWLLSSVLDDSTDEVPSPYYSWSDHSLPITDVACGIGDFCSARVLTSSLDHTCKLWDLSTGYLLTTFVFPTAITAVALDPAERMFFAGGRDNLIYQVNLYRKLDNSSFGIEITSVGGGGIIEDVASQHRENDTDDSIPSCSSPITTLSLSYDVTLILSGSQDGNVRVWDVNSRQMNPKVIRPIISKRSSDEFDYVPKTTRSFQNRTQQSLIPEDSDAEESVVLVLSDNTKIGDETTALQTKVSELQSELNRIRGHYQRVKGLHDEMYQELVSEFMTKRREGN